jgi:micrococcal nuclease
MANSEENQGCLSGCLGTLFKGFLIFIGIFFVIALFTDPETNQNSQPNNLQQTVDESNPTEKKKTLPKSRQLADKKKKPERPPKKEPAPDKHPTQPSPQEETADTAEIVEVTDGDTVKVRFPDGRTRKVRLLGIDTPEVYGKNDPAEFEGVPNNNAGYKCLRKWGERASKYANRTLHGKVTVKRDSVADREGSYGRLLAYVIKDGVNFNYSLVKKGYARVYDSEFTQSESFYTAERIAQNSGRGLWECRDVRSTTTPIPLPET